MFVKVCVDVYPLTEDEKAFTRYLIIRVFYGSGNNLMRESQRKIAGAEPQDPDLRGNGKWQRAY
jgi:hypothetical protein